MRVALRWSADRSGDVLCRRTRGAQVYRGNDTGGIIPWSCENEAAGAAMSPAAYCARYGKFRRITSVQPAVRQLHRLQLPVAAGHRALSDPGGAHAPSCVMPGARAAPASARAGALLTPAAQRVSALTVTSTCMPR